VVLARLASAAPRSRRLLVRLRAHAPAHAPNGRRRRGAHTCQVQNGNTALILAAWSGHTECVRELLKGGAEKEAKDNVRVGRWFSVVCSIFYQYQFAAGSIFASAGSLMSRILCTTINCICFLKSLYVHFFNHSGFFTIIFCFLLDSVAMGDVGT
jgi:hypothetical protein